MSGKGMGGIAVDRNRRRLGLGGWPGFCADTVLVHKCNTNKTTKALPGNKDVHFLFIVDFFFYEFNELSRECPFFGTILLIFL
jgi:hypothetical protein